MSLESFHELCIGTKPSGPIFQETICDLLHMIYHKNKCCLARYFFEVLSPPSLNMRVQGKLGPSKSSPSKLGPSLIWRQIGPHTFWCRGKLGPWKMLLLQIGPWQIGPWQIGHTRVKLPCSFKFCMQIWFDFYRTRVRSLAMLVTHSLTHWLTDSLTPV